MFGAQIAKNSSNAQSTKPKTVPKMKPSLVSNGTGKRLVTARKSVGRLDKLPQKKTASDISKKNDSNVFQQFTCTGAMPDVHVHTVKRPPGSSKPVSARPSLKVPIRSKLGPVNAGHPLKSPRALANVAILKGPKVKMEPTPRATTAILRPCKCPACVKKRASGAIDNLPAEGHIPQVSPKGHAPLISPKSPLKPVVNVPPKPNIAPVKINNSEKLPISTPKLQELSKNIPHKENFDNIDTWQIVGKDKKPNGPMSLFKNILGKPMPKDNNPICPDKTVDILRESKEDTQPDFGTGLDSISVKWSEGPGQPKSIYGLERKESLATTHCESFNFVEMPPHSVNKANDDNAPYIALNAAKNYDVVIRSQLGSRNGLRPQAVIEWKKGNMLGRGAFGTVWSGLTITGELIAVKQAEISSIDIEKANKEYEKVQQEVELLKSLHHDNIVGYLGTCLHGRVVSIFMQYIPGGSLASILKQFGPLAEPVVSRYTKQILDGVGYLHSKNVIHRDLKGNNIMLVPNGVIKLIDFGCAKKLMNITKSNAEILKSMKGTPYWMAPEVVNETGHGKKSDIWSIGCTVYEMASAKPPWSDLNRYAALFAISNGTAGLPKLSDKFTQEAKDFVSLCLKREPKERPDVEKFLQHKFILDYWQPESRIQDSRGIAVNSNKKL